MDNKSKSKTNVLEQIYVYENFLLSFYMKVISFRHDVYNRLGSTTLTHDTTAWPNVRKFLHRISLQEKNALVADVGMLAYFSFNLSYRIN